MVSHDTQVNASGTSVVGIVYVFEYSKAVYEAT